mgnify:CR=1 FL=1
MKKILAVVFTLFSILLGFAMGRTGPSVSPPSPADLTLCRDGIYSLFRLDSVDGYSCHPDASGIVDQSAGVYLCECPRASPEPPSREADPWLQH